MALVIIGIATSSASAQKPLEQLVKTLDSLSAKRAPSLVYLQPSKGIYETGEDLWFKGYVMDSRSLQPSLKETTLYVQLLR